MKKLLFFPLTILCFFVLHTDYAYAGTSTLSFGIVRSDIHGVMDNAHGINVKFLYGFDDSHWGGVGSLTYVEHTGIDSLGVYNKLKYGSVAGGPMYRFNDWVSLYGLLGISSGSHRITPTDAIRATYGAGLQFTLLPEMALDISYEKSHFSHLNIDTWTVGLGYRF